ncbi:hypothetical protein [Streptomyces sp. ML-6]|uniref:hypothetical protein n=1 Tax=Streptomyces sp. ML-6 TaxID=2982693 RepID=UPI0024BFAA5D|nr:hypothetical protein [Streptomyces sp. ML-6]MDK0523124.1 hypothetical protein [Streptomyces sp. ML-6]
MSRAVFHGGPAGVASDGSRAGVRTGGARAVAPAAHGIRAADALGTGPRAAG